LSIEDCAATAAALGSRISHDRSMLTHVAATVQASIEGFAPVSEDLDELAGLYTQIGDDSKAAQASGLSDDAGEIQVKVEAAHNLILNAITDIDVCMRELEDLIAGIHGLDS